MNQFESLFFWFGVVTALSFLIRLPFRIRRRRALRREIAILDRRIKEREAANASDLSNCHELTGD